MVAALTDVRIMADRSKATSSINAPYTSTHTPFKVGCQIGKSTPGNQNIWLASNPEVDLSLIMRIDYAKVTMRIGKDNLKPKRQNLKIAIAYLRNYGSDQIEI